MNHTNYCNLISNTHLLYGLGGSNQVVDSVGDEGAFERRDLFNGQSNPIFGRSRNGTYKEIYITACNSCG